MFNEFLPPRIDNTFRGHKAAIWLFSVTVFIRLIQSVSAIFNAHTIARTADGIPLERYPSAAAETIVALFALSALSRLLICGLCVLALVRYRSVIPFMFGLLLVQSLSGKAVLHFLPIAQSGFAPGVYVNLILMSLMAAGFALSLWERA